MDLGLISVRYARALLKASAVDNSSDKMYVENVISIRKLYKGA